MIPAKKDIAFVDFGDEASSTLAKEALNGYKIGEGDEAAPMKVSTTPTPIPPLIFLLSSPLPIFRISCSSNASSSLGLVVRFKADTFVSSRLPSFLVPLSAFPQGHLREEVVVLSRRSIVYDTY